MNLEAINKWLDEEYGCSYTKLEELHDFYFEKYCDLKQENKDLKKQLEQYKGSHYCSLIDICKSTKIANYNQQKEFIDYLENEINKLKEQIKNYDIWHEVGTDINFLILKKQFYLEILQKYKEIIGVSDEHKTTI